MGEKKLSSGSDKHGGITAEATSTETYNPFSQIKQDFWSLVDRSGRLEHEMRISHDKWELDTKKMLLEFIEVADAFENTIWNLESRIDSLDEKSREWLGHFSAVFKLLMRSLRTAGITPIEVMVGKKASPYWHKVVEVTKQPDRENEIILKVVKKGYLWHKQLLRTAEVIAVKND
jgi:molecular chaperone GrpE